MTDFKRRFGEFDVMECITASVSNPFMPIDIEQVAAKFQQVFASSSGADMQIVEKLHRAES